MCSTKLNMGAGADIRNKEDGWINIDMRNIEGVDMVLNLENDKLPFSDCSIDHIEAKDVLEHFSWRRTEDVLREWCRVLKSEGTIYIQMPDIDAIITAYVNREHGFITFDRKLLPSQLFSYWIFGEQGYPANTHKAGLNHEDLRTILDRVGFVVDKINNDGGSNIMCFGHKR